LKALRRWSTYWMYGDISADTPEIVKYKYDKGELKTEE
jgi:hypothetical protein